MKKDLTVRKIDWQEYSRLCKLIAERAKLDFQPEEIVGIARGGVIVGATIASLLKIDFFPIKFSRRVSEQVVRKHPKLLVPPTAHLETKRVLLVDDFCKTGETIRSALREINKLKPNIVASAVLVRAGQFQPDYYAIYSGGGVIFPWEESPRLGQEFEDEGVPKK